jgi:hypothetical protein
VELLHLFAEQFVEADLAPRQNGLADDDPLVGRREPQEAVV